jgi:uncharacterized Zn finger protein
VTEEASAPSTRAGASVHSGVLWCDSCREETPHRILRADRRTRGSAISGVARCQQCRWTHPFRAAPPEGHRITLIISRGNVSTTETAETARRTVWQVGQEVPGDTGGRRITAIDRRDGRRVPFARGEEVATVWCLEASEHRVAVSLTGGRLTSSVDWPVPPEREITVGGRIEVNGREWTVAGLRARGATWRRDGDRFAAREVDRVYARRTARPPPGSSRWSAERGTPRPSASATSAAARSRSGPGVRRYPRRPRERRADGGATTQRRAPR